MSIVIHGPAAQEKLRAAGRVAAEVLHVVTRRIEPGITTARIDQWVREETRRRGAHPSQLGYHGFPAAVCVSRNQVVCHGIPSSREFVAEGDILNVDVTIELDGYHGDTSTMVCVGELAQAARRIVDVALQARAAGVAALRPDARLGDVAAAVQQVAHAAGCSVVRELGGHGIGRQMHQEPHVPYVGRAGKGVRLRSGMALTIEPMLNLGAPDVLFLDDGWTVVTRDGSLSAQFEHTVLITETGHEVLTPESDSLLPFRRDAGSGARLDESPATQAAPDQAQQAAAASSTRPGSEP